MGILLCALSWAVVYGDHQVTMHGDSSDMQQARKYLPQLGPGYLWFRKDGRQFVVKDARVLEEIEETVRPQQELGMSQARLGRVQADLGRQQGALGRRQASASPDEQRDLAGAQSALGREQARIGREQAKMGKKQRELSEHMEHRVAELVDASLKDGSAREVR